MAEFDLKIGTVRLDATYSEMPGVASSSVMDADYVERTTEVSTTSGSYIYDWMMQGSSFDPNEWYVVWVQATFGGKTDKTECEIQVVLGPEASPTIYGHAVARGYPGAIETPRSQQASNLNRVFVIKNTNQYDLGVRYLSTTQQSVYIEGLSMMKMKLDSSLMDQNTDWFASQDTSVNIYPDGVGSDVVGSQYTVFEADLPIVEPGEYIIWANCEVKSSTPSGVEDRWINCEVNGTTIDTDWWTKINKNGKDRHHYYSFAQVSLPVGTTNVKIIGKAVQGLGIRSYYRPSIFMLRLAKFQNYVYRGANVPAWTALADVHPLFGLVRSETFTIPATDTNVMVWGGMHMRRGSNGGKIVRLKMDSVNRGDFMCDANTTGSITGDEPYVYTFGMKAANLPVAVRLEASNGSAPLTTFPANYTEVKADRLFMLSTLIESGPLSSFSAIVENNIGVSEDITPKSYPLSENVGVGEVVSYSTAGPGANRPGTSFPRLWFGDQGFYDGLIASKTTNSAAWQLFQSGFGDPGLYIRGYVEAIWYALEFVATGGATAKANALSYLQSELDADLKTHSVYNKYRLWAESTRNIACAYDWLKAYSPADITTTMDEQVHNWMMLTSYLRYTARQNPLADQILGGDAWDWASNNPYQNYYEGSMMAMAYAAITLEDSPYLNGTTNRLRTGTPAAGFEWPFNSGSQTGGFMTWEIPFDDWDHSQGFYTDPWQFVIDRIENMTLPALDTRAAGGDWLEGSNYGRGALRRHMEMMNVIRYASGLDYPRDPAHQWMQDIPLAQIHAIQPGNSRLFFLGDVGGGLPMAPKNYNRNLMLQCADALEGKPGGQYAQYWLDNIYTAMDLGVNEQIPFDFWMWRPRTDNNYKLSRSPQYTADGTGMVNSRTNWLDDDTAVSFNQIAQDVQQGHTHHDGGGIQLWVGGQSGDGGWYLVDRKVTAGSGDRWESMEHNCLVFRETVHSHRIGQRFKDSGRPPVAVLDKNEHTTEYTYTQVQANSAYDLEFSDRVDKQGNILEPGPRAPLHYSDGDDTILNNYQRESVFLRSIGPYLVVYDRVEMGAVGATNSYFSGTDYYSFGMHQYWHFIGSQPVSIGGNVYRYGDSTNKRMFFQFFGNTSTTWTDETTSQVCWQLEVELDSASRLKNLIAVFEPTTTATASAATVTQITGSDAVTGGGATGVCIEDAAGYQAVLFCTERSGMFVQQDGAGVPMFLQYSSPLSVNSIHTVCNLNPGTTYQVTSVNMGATIDVTITHSTTESVYLASSAGVITFDPLNPVQGSDFSYIVTDKVGVSNPTPVMGIGYTIIENIGSADNDAYGLASAAQHDEIDNIGVSDSTVPSYGFPVNDGVPIYDIVDYTVGGNPPTYKDIPTLTKKVFPQVILQGGWVGNPDDAVPHEKVNNGVDTPNDDEYLVAEGVQSSNNAAILTMAAPSPTITPQRVRFRLRTREIFHAASPSLTMQAELYEPNASLIAVQTYSLGSGFNYQTINFPWLDYANEDPDNMYVILRAVSPTWDANTRVELSEMELEFHYKGIEKVT